MKPLLLIALTIGVSGVARAEGKPRVLVMIAEQNVGRAEAAAWWRGAKVTDLDALENAFAKSLIAQGFTVVDHQALQGKIGAGAPTSEASDAAIKSFAQSSGAQVVVIGKALATDAGSIMGTPMHSVRANLSLRALNLDDGRIIAAATLSHAAGHVDPISGGTQAFVKAAEKSAEELGPKIAAAWSQEEATTITLTVKNVKSMGALLALNQTLRAHLGKLKALRQRSFAAHVAIFELDFAGAGDALAADLAAADPKLEVQGFTAHTVAAALK